MLYEFIAASVFYWFVAASIAELASAIPSSAGVYHWASVTPGHKWGRVNGKQRAFAVIRSRKDLHSYQVSLAGTGTGLPGSSPALQ